MATADASTCRRVDPGRTSTCRRVDRRRDVADDTPEFRFCP
jgi:hypothetical protein